jgi:hypothetical protein
LDSDKSNMRKALLEFVVPQLQSRGFTGAFPHFRRFVEDRVDLLSFQFSSCFDSFVLEISQCPVNGLQMEWGKFIPAQNATAFDTNPRYRWRLVPVQASEAPKTEEQWFSYEDGQYEQVAKSVLPFLDEGEWWWEQPRDLQKIGFVS